MEVTLTYLSDFILNQHVSVEDGLQSVYVTRMESPKLCISLNVELQLTLHLIFHFSFSTQGISMTIRNLDSPDLTLLISLRSNSSTMNAK